MSHATDCAPDVLRHDTQWQTADPRGSPATLYLTLPQKHPPSRGSPLIISPYPFLVPATILAARRSLIAVTNLMERSADHVSGQRDTVPAEELLVGQNSRQRGERVHVIRPDTVELLHESLDGQRPRKRPDFVWAYRHVDSDLPAYVRRSPPTIAATVRGMGRVLFLWIIRLLYWPWKSAGRGVR